MDQPLQMRFVYGFFYFFSVLSSPQTPQEISFQATDSRRSDLDNNPRKRPKLSPPQVIDLTDSRTSPLVSPNPENPYDTKKLFATKSVKNVSHSIPLRKQQPTPF